MTVTAATPPKGAKKAVVSPCVSAIPPSVAPRLRIRRRPDSVSIGDFPSESVDHVETDSVFFGSGCSGTDDECLLFLVKTC